MNRAVFLDRDGTLIEDVHYLRAPSQIRLEPGIESLARLREAGFLLICVTNQSGVARGYFDESTVEAVHRELRSLLADRGVAIDATYYCPHHPEGEVERYTRRCRCRKPAPGLLEQAAREHDIRLEASWLFGDSVRDVEAAAAVDAKGILLQRGKSTDRALDDIPPAATAFVPDLKTAVETVLKAEDAREAV